MRAKLKWNFKILVISLLIVSLLASTFLAYSEYAKREISLYQSELQFYQVIAAQEQAWIADMQLETGALPFRHLSNGTAVIIPYFSAIAGLSLLQDVKLDYTHQVEAYIDWMLSHLNDEESDYFSIDGTISNFRIEYFDESTYQETPYKYDSVDSYSALMISLIMRTYTRTNDLSLLKRNEAEIIRVFNALLSTRMDNDLSSVSVGNKTQYLMDNVEVNDGLKEGILLIDAMLENALNTQALLGIKIELSEWLNKHTQAIENLLWNGDDNVYYPALNSSNQIVAFKSWDNFYPDAVAQLFPILYEVIPAKSDRAERLYEKFSQTYKWEDFIYRDAGDFYWTVIVYVAAQMEDVSRVKKYMEYYQTNIMDQHPYPLYNAEAAWIVNASHKMMDYYRTKIEKIDPLRLFH